MVQIDAAVRSGSPLDGDTQLILHQWETSSCCFLVKLAARKSDCLADFDEQKEALYQMDA